MKCKLTGTEGKGINAHVIPKSFYTIDPDEPRPTKLLTNTEGRYPKKSPIGIYDDSIVTEEGERFFSKLDDYAKELLLDRKGEFQELWHEGELAAYQLPEYDYDCLKLFVLSVLWRASSSRHEFFRRVALGPHEEVIRHALLQGDAGDTDWFSVSLARWSDHGVGVGMMDPYRTRLDGINYYVIYLEHYIAYCKVDKRIASQERKSIQLKPDEPLMVVAREAGKSKERGIMLDIVNRNNRGQTTVSKVLNWRK